MPHVFLISDTHFSHENICKFVGQDGKKIRPFESAADMDAFMIEKWNDMVREGDKVYHLGDVTCSGKGQHALDRIMPQLHGTKVLIKGNHDKCKLAAYHKWFKDVRSSHRLDKLLLTHIPVHPDSIPADGFNVHGHIHERVIKDARYLNICVEHTDYAPVELGALLAWARLKKGVPSNA